MDQEDNYSQLYKKDNIGNYSESQDQLLNFKYSSQEYYQHYYQNSQSQLEEKNSQFLEQQQINDIPIKDLPKILNNQFSVYSKINDIQIPSPLDEGKQQDESLVDYFQSQPHQLLNSCSPQFPINDFHTNEQNLNLNQFNVISQNGNFPQQNQQVQTSTELLKNKKKQLKPQENQSQHQEPQVFQNEQEQKKKSFLKNVLSKFQKKL
ncbi:unnamed protein product [Paramecium pentaurelia]|uniref:Uncharacterized protein n=1 Tax=Paramecium pentaurelia TaxID=43138 RepID=A0A8S1VVM4_9CILI|nr:unnamed protein product [Paramecium pentaurelia]